VGIDLGGRTGGGGLGGGPVASRYRGTSFIRNNPLLGPYIRTMSRAVWWP